MDLSAHFTSAEFECHGIDCCGHTAVVHPWLILGLEQLRTDIGKPLYISCGFRCRKHNAETKNAVRESWHSQGMAADIFVRGMDSDAVAARAEYVTAFRHGGIGLYTSFVHLDIGPMRRWKG